MAYGHAERTLDAIRRLEAETAALLARLPELDYEQAGWLQEAVIGGHAGGARDGYVGCPAPGGGP